MLKKLKFKFILINMIMVGVVMAFIFTAVCAFTYRTEKQQIEFALEQVLRKGSGLQKPGDHPDGSQNAPQDPPFGNENRVPQLGGKDDFPYIMSFSVELDETGVIIGHGGYGADMDDETMQAAVSSALGQDMERGTLKELSLTYVLQHSPRGTSIAFASTEHLNTTIRNTAMIAGGVCLISLLIFFFLSYILAGLAIRPTEAAWKSQKQFVEDASHDLKTPITVILANQNILLSHKKDTVESQAQWIESTEEEARRMKSLADRMLQLAKTESENFRPELEITAISEMTESTCLQFEPVAFDKEIGIVSDIEQDIAIKTHGESYVRLLYTLIDNAIKYSPAGDQVTVILKRLKGQVRLSVNNKGAPIPREDLPRIFDRFYRTDKSRSVGGHGLGLAIAKNITEALGGRISAESNESTGTTFTVIFK